MSAHTAYCLVDSILKDPTDQSLVTEADAEHMYARLDRIPDTSPTPHENLSRSDRTPHHSRRMSRRTPKHGKRSYRNPQLEDRYDLYLF